jgi:cell division protein FtsB
MQGDRGLIALWQLNQRIEVARVHLSETSQKRSVLAHRVKLLARTSLDPDMLDERARLMLNYGHPNETVIFRRPAPKRR